MANWDEQLHYDPLRPLLASGDEALQYFTRRDLLGEHVGSPHLLWELPEAKHILRKRLTDGAWPRSGEQKHPAINYRLIETWRQYRYLVEQYGFTREHPEAREGR